MKKTSKLNEFIQHTIDSESYGNITKDEAVRLLQTLYKEISDKLRKSTYVFSKSAYEKLLKEIEGLINEYKSKTIKLYEETISDISSYQSRWLSDFLSETVKDLIIPASLLSSVKFSPIANVTDYKGLVENEAYKIRQNVESSLRTAYITKEEMNNVADRFEKREPVIEKEVAANTKMINTASFSAVNYLIYKTNHIKVVYCAILDSRTCIECGELNGNEYNYKEQPMLPMHWGCRCSLVPKDSLGEEEMPQSFSDWFESLTEEEKIEAVGKSRYEMYKAGIPVTSFVDSQNKLIPVRELGKSQLEISEAKLISYSLNSNSPKGKDKAYLFDKMLGYNQSNWKDLESQIDRLVNVKDMQYLRVDEFGERYRCDILVKGPNGNTAKVRTGWIKQKDSSIYKMTTAYPLKERSK